MCGGSAVFKLNRITKDYREAAALCAQINLFGFVDDEIFLTKSGDLGIVLSIEGVDYECVDSNTIDNLTRRLAAAFRVFDEKCRVYQYLFKRNRENIPFKTYQNPIVNAAIRTRMEYLKTKAESLYSFQICYVVLYEGFRHNVSILNSFAKITSQPGDAMRELQAFVCTRKQVLLIDDELQQSLSALHAKARSFVGQVSDFVGTRLLAKDEAFRVLKQILNFSPLKIENARLRRDTFLDYYLCESHVECHRGFLRVDDYYVKVLSLKEPSAQSFPLIFKRLLEVKGNYFGNYSLTIVLYDEVLAKVESACADFYKAFNVHDAQLYEEKYNLFNAYLATVPGNYAFNLRSMLILNTNYADYSLLFTLHSGHQVNSHLKQEYLAVLETNHRTPYYLNLHCKDTAHTVILGRTGSGKSFTLNFLITNLQKYDPYTFIFDLGGSFEHLTRLFEGSYVKVGPHSAAFKINPFCLPKTKSNLDFLALFVQVLADNHGGERLSLEGDPEVYHQIEHLYSVDPELRTLGVLANTLPRGLSSKLHKWTSGGQFGFLFDNAQDTVSFSRFQCFDFQGMEHYPQILEPLLFYILHRANHVITNREITHIFKAFFIDEAWTFFRNFRIKGYIVEALKTWRKQNAAMN